MLLQRGCSRRAALAYLLGASVAFARAAKALAHRFMVGTDSSHLSPQMSGLHMPRAWQIRLFINELPDEIARRVGSLNAQRIFNLPVA